MIDVIFAILTFFIMSTLFLTRNKGLDVDLPSAATAQQDISTPITVTVNYKGQIGLNRQSVTLNVLTEEVRNLTGDKQEVLVVINADEQASHGQVIAGMDCLRQVQAARIAIATETARNFSTLLEDI
jgi:biopolymer transport protein ExbD